MGTQPIPNLALAGLRAQRWGCVATLAVVYAYGIAICVASWPLMKLLTYLLGSCSGMGEACCQLRAFAWLINCLEREILTLQRWKRMFGLKWHLVGCISASLVVLLSLPSILDSRSLRLVSDLRFQEGTVIVSHGCIERRTPPPRCVAIGDPSMGVSSLLAVRCCTNVSITRIQSTGKLGKSRQKSLGRKPDDTLKPVPMKKYGCHGRKTYQEAHAICKAAGYHVCSFSEIASGVTCATGCGFDDREVWTSSLYDRNVCI